MRVFYQLYRFTTYACISLRNLCFKNQNSHRFYSVSMILSHTRVNLKQNNFNRKEDTFLCLRKNSQIIFRTNWYSVIFYNIYLLKRFVVYYLHQLSSKQKRKGSFYFTYSTDIASLLNCTLKKKLKIDTSFLIMDVRKCIKTVARFSHMMGFDSFLCHIANFQFYLAIVASIDIMKLITRVISLHLYLIS